MAKLSAVKRSTEECVRREQKRQETLELCKGALKMDTGVCLLHMELYECQRIPKHHILFLPLLFFLSVNLFSVFWQYSPFWMFFFLNLLPYKMGFKSVLSSEIETKRIWDYKKKAWACINIHPLILIHIRAFFCAAVKAASLLGVCLDKFGTSNHWNF